MAKQHPIRVIAVTGGKGGIGKTNISINLGLSLIQKGESVMLLDADLGLANIDLLLGIKPERNLQDVMNGDVDLQDIVVEGPRGIKVIPAATGVASLTQLSAQENAGLISAFSTLDTNIDTLIVDTAAGLSEAVTSFAAAAHEVLLVVCDEPTSIADAYAMLKILNQRGIKKFQVVTNMVHSQQEGRNLFAKLTRVADRFLDVSLQHLGVIPQDKYLKMAVQRRQPVVEAYPGSKVARAFDALATKVHHWPSMATPAGQVTFFVDRLVQHS